MDLKNLAVFDLVVFGEDETPQGDTALRPAGPCPSSVLIGAGLGN